MPVDDLERLLAELSNEPGRIDLFRLPAAVSNDEDGRSTFWKEERELSEIAAMTGLSEGTVKAHLSRAVGRVRAELGRRQ